MRDYGKVHTSFWSSTDIRSLSEDARILSIYLLTCPHSTIAGVFRLPDGYACEDLQWDSGRVKKGFTELFAKGFANRCETTKWVVIFKHFDWNPPENPNQRKAAAKVARQVPDQCCWKPQFIRLWGEFLGFSGEEIAKGLETVREPFLNQKQKQEQEQEQEQENNDVSDLANSEAKKTESSSSPDSSDGADRKPPERSPVQIRALAIAVFLRERGASLTHADPRVIDWAESGVTDTQLLQALDTAKAQREEKNDPSQINAGYLDSILNSQKRKALSNARGQDRPLTQAEKRSQVAAYQFRNLTENHHANESTIIDITPASESE